MTHRHPGQIEDCQVAPDEPTGWRAVLKVVGYVVFLAVEVAVVVGLVFAGQGAVR